MDLHPNPMHEMSLLEQIESDPDVTQASLAMRLGVAVGTVNWHLKRLIAKGYVKVKRAERRKLRYIITPEGIAFRARLTVDYIEQSFLLYRSIRQRVSRLLEDVRLAGYNQVYIQGDGDIADICRLTCLENMIPVLGSIPPKDRDNILQPGHAPILEVRGLKVVLHMDSKV
jgi:DNA-binding MarR family transcriptional regulator